MNQRQEELFPEENFEPPPDVFPSAFLARDPDAPLLTSVRINGLKGFDDCLIHLSRLTLLTGPNNSGKSTVLQAITLGFECFRRCLDTSKWTLRSAGRSVSEFEFLPVNEPKDLWYEKVWKPSAKEERYVRVTLSFSNGFEFSARLRFLFGGINLGVEDVQGDPNEQTLKSLSASAPVLLPTTPGPSAHEDYFPLAQIHRLLTMREPSRVIRNVALRLSQQAAEGDPEGLDFLNHVLSRYFKTELAPITFDESKDLEVRAPLRGEDESFSLDAVSAGSGLNQILMLAAVLAWRRPGIVLLDEPDAHLHSSVQAQLLDFLSDLSSRFNIQIIAATHSRDLISRAPLQSIVPVDRMRKEVGPLESLDHLLLEFERHGAVSNVDLALLYQTRRCVFLEGASDVTLLPRMADRLGFDLFTGHDQLVPFEFEGVDKIRLIPDLVGLFEKMIGAKLRWGVVRDNDAHLPEVREALLESAEERGFPVFHMWKRYSIENYLLDTPLLVTAIENVDADAVMTEADVRMLLQETVNEIEDDVGGVFVNTAQGAFRDILERDDWYAAGAKAAVRHLKSVSSLEQKLIAYPGRKVFGRLVQHLQEQYGIHLRIDDVVASLKADIAPGELIEVLETLSEV